MKIRKVVVLSAIIAVLFALKLRASGTDRGCESAEAYELQRALERLEAQLRYYEQLMVRNLLAESDIPRLELMRRFIQILRSRIPASN